MKIKSNADHYILNNKANTNQSMRPKYHFSAPVGWMNDPNGLIFYNSEYHVYYQYNPYEAVWGPMHWGHAVSKDLISYSDAPVALAPDREDEDGCFSGGAIIDQASGELVILYTRHLVRNDVVSQVQARASSRDGFAFKKQNEAVITSDDLPEGFSVSDFRDPNPVFVDGAYYVFVGGKSDKGKGCVLVYQSKDLKKFHFFMTIELNEFSGEMTECPDFFRLDGKDILLFSAVGMKEKDGRFLNYACPVYFLGTLDFKNKVFNVENADELDGGFDFYAPQTLDDNRGRRIMLGWLQMMNANDYLNKNGHNWNGSFTFPRELFLNKNTLVQRPIREIENYYAGRLEYRMNDRLPKSQDASFSFKSNASVIFYNPLNEKDYFSIGVENGRFYFENGTLSSPRGRRYSKLQLKKDYTVRLLMDRSSVEIFIADGADVLTSTIFMECDYLLAKFIGEVIVLNAHSI